MEVDDDEPGGGRTTDAVDAFCNMASMETTPPRTAPLTARSNISLVLPPDGVCCAGLEAAGGGIGGGTPMGRAGGLLTDKSSGSH